MAKIIVTGSTGFIGKRLIYQLLEAGHEIYALIRIKGVVLKSQEHRRLHFLYGDIRDPDCASLFPKDIDAAYYLVHSMGGVVQNLKEEEERVARHFIEMIEKTQAKQIIFLGGIVEDVNQLSPHLLSRLSVENVLCSCKISCTILRASIIIGSGSASFEIIRDLVEKLPMMIAPKWVKSMCQPIAVRDVLFYLQGVLLNERCFGQIYDIGGPEAISFKEVLIRYARFRHLRRFILDVPVLTPRLSSYWLVLITSVRFSICSYLVESMKHNTRKINKGIDAVLPHKCMYFEEALKIVFDKIAHNEVVSTWMDSWNLDKSRADIQDFIEVPQEGCLKDIQIISVCSPLEKVQERIWSIGGDRGWYALNWAWKLRGLIDKIVGGAGLNRGRRHPHELAVGDSVDFWRVLLADEKKRRLILYAGMKLPGEAWLEFEINEKEMLFKQTATFRPKGFLGRLYWYVFLPFHFLIFRKMAQSIARASR